MTTTKTQKIGLIGKVVIDLGDGKTIELDREKAEQLRDLLVDYLGAKPSQWDEIKKQLDKIERDRIHDPITIPVPYPVPYLQPYPVYPRHYYPWWEPTITWTSGTSAVQGLAHNATLQLTCKT